MPVVWTSLVLPLVGTLLTLSSKVIELAGTARRYRKKCQLLKDRVRLIANHLGEMERRGAPDSSPATQNTLKDLQKVLVHAQELVQSCQRKRKAFDFLRALKKTGEFSFVGKRISNIMESFHMANRTLIQGLYGDRFFMVLLKSLLQDYDARRVLQQQNGRGRLEIALRGLTYSSNNMTPEKKEILDAMEEALGPAWLQRYAERKPASYSEDVEEIANIAKDIVLRAEAESHSKAEVERLTQLARQLLYFLPNLQTPQLARHPETPGLVLSLCYNLEAAHEATVAMAGGGTLLQCAGRGATVMSFSSNNSKRIWALGNSIEESYQRLTFIAMHQILNQA